MTEKIQVNGKDLWVVVEPHVAHQPGGPQEYFTASYYSTDPAGSPGGVLFLEEDGKPVVFSSPVEALEYASEKLLGLL